MSIFQMNDVPQRKRKTSKLHFVLVIFFILLVKISRCSNKKNEKTVNTSYPLFIKSGLKEIIIKISFGGIAVFNKKFCIVFVFMFLLLINHSVLAYGKEFSMNQDQTLQSADEFYNKVLDKNQYKEYRDSELKIRKLTTIKELPETFKEIKWDYVKNHRHPFKEDFVDYTKRFNPERQVYYFLSLKDTDKVVFYKSALFDAKTKELIYRENGKWSKETMKNPNN
jgi:hypothetical protein